MVSTAKLRFLGVSAQKTRLVIDQVRGKNVNEALSVLRYSPKRVAHDVEKLVQSAVANARQKDSSIDIDRLVVSRAVVDDAPPMKRIRQQSMGRVFRVLKRACHVTIGLDAPATGGR